MRRPSFLVAIGALLLSLSSVHIAKADWLSGGGLGRCGEPCVVSLNFGGPIRPFLKAAKDIKAGARRQVVITWVCASSCSLFADKVRPRVCIMPSTVFVFHRSYQDIVQEGKSVRVWDTGDPPYSQDIISWVHAHGGFPKTDHYDDMTKMKVEEARRFFPLCTKKHLHPSRM